ncbi:hypothetical protein CVT25_011704 [Psilocybe cyanescens]|uniref:Uncharacterized protein n=1 Tax=Psilocybe cyanescens TaxID=93625 RepID=A0A409WIJ8_PSICY|nr:hypothetical protein CVT25_011704 [Psilocybe cyanescens]
MFSLYHEQLYSPGTGAGATAQTISSSIIEQVAGYDAQLRAKIAAKIKSDKSLASADVVRQFRALIVNTISADAESDGQLMMIGLVLIVIDGSNTIAEDERYKFLTIIADYSKKTPPEFSPFDY